MRERWYFRFIEISLFFVCKLITIVFCVYLRTNDSSYSVAWLYECELPTAAAKSYGASFFLSFFHSFFLFFFFSLSLCLSIYTYIDAIVFAIAITVYTSIDYTIPHSFLTPFASRYFLSYVEGSRRAVFHFSITMNIFSCCACEESYIFGKLVHNVANLFSQKLEQSEKF